MTKLTNVEGIGPSYAAKLTAAGCRSQEHMLKVAGTKAGRNIGNRQDSKSSQAG